MHEGRSRNREHRPWLHLTGLWSIVIVGLLVTLAGYVGWVSFSILVIVAAWGSSIAFGSRRGLQAVRRLDAHVKRVQSWHPAKRWLLAISFGVGVAVLGGVINR